MGLLPRTLISKSGTSRSLVLGTILLLFCPAWLSAFGCVLPAQEPPSSNSPDQPKPKQNPQKNEPQKSDQNKPATEDPQVQKPGTLQSIGVATEGAAMEAAHMTKDAARATVGELRKWEVDLFTGPYIGRGVPFAPLTEDQRLHMYLEQTWTTPNPYWKRMFAAEFDQMRDEPSQWGEGIGGYGQRFASHQAQFATANTLAALINAKLRYEPRYDECGCVGFWPRTRHAISRNFYTYNETESDKRPQLGLYGGAFLAGMLSSTWKPGHNVFREAGYGAAGQAGFGILFDMFVEYAPDIARKIGARKRPRDLTPP